MKAAILRDGAMIVEEIDELTPGPGQVLVETVACGICGSDLHTVDHTEHFVATATEAGNLMMFDPDKDLVMGHELSVKVLETGSGVDGVEPDTMMAAMPYLTTPDGFAVPGYDNQYPGGYAQQMLLDPGSLLPIPNGLAPPLAALTEPMAVGLHAVNESSIKDGQAAIVIGCGPVRPGNHRRACPYKRLTDYCQRPFSISACSCGSDGSRHRDRPRNHG